MNQFFAALSGVPRGAARRGFPVVWRNFLAGAEFLSEEGDLVFFEEQAVGLEFFFFSGLFRRSFQFGEFLSVGFESLGFLYVAIEEVALRSFGAAGHAFEETGQMGEFVEFVLLEEVDRRELLQLCPHPGVGDRLRGLFLL